MRPRMLLLIAVVALVVGCFGCGSDSSTVGRNYKDGYGNTCDEGEAHYGDHWAGSGLAVNEVWCPASATGSGQQSRPATSPAQSRPATNSCWRVVATGAKVPYLTAVAAISPSDVWAVGGNNEDAGTATPVIVHWDGKRLRSYSAFKPSGRDGELTAISAVASDDVWAVGVDGWVSGRPIVIHWDGRRWQTVRTPMGVKGGLRDVKAFSSRDVWAVGGSLVMHWDGRTWRTFDVRRMVNSSSSLASIDGASPRDLWAVGVQDLEAPSLVGLNPLSLHWDGRSWRKVPAPAFTNASASIPVSQFNAVDVRSANDVWTLAFSYGAETDSFFRWNGRWQSFAYGYEGGGNLEDLAAVSPNNVWAVGRFLSAFPLVVHGDGKSWRIKRTPLDDLRGTTLNGLSALSPNEIWAVGNHLIVRYSC